jgi:methionyl-tRNA synthetase
VRTTAAHHKKGVRALIERILERNPDDVYEKTYEGWYCVGCELFKRDDEIQDGHCVLHPTRELQWTEERNFFFRLTRYQDFLRAHFEANPGFLLPVSRRNEMLALMDSGLEDISVTRARLSWAIPFPRTTSDGEQWWPAQLHVVGKDIVRLHSIIWPAMLHSAGLPLPEAVWGHGFVLLGGERFSKSSGVGLDLGEAIDRFGPDALRYFLLREVPWDADGNFSWERFTDRYTSELANGLGNLASRTTSMLAKYRGGAVPGSPVELDGAIASAVEAYRAAMDANLLHEGAAAAYEVVRHANTLVAERQPWSVAKDPSRSDELDLTLAAMVRYLAAAAVMLSPFMPGKMADLWARLGSGRDSLPSLDELATLDVSGWKTSAGGILFPRPEVAATA